MTSHLEPELLILADDPHELPSPHKALHEPEGLAAIGGDLTPKRLLNMYQHGFFPWFSEQDPILWWHPAERCVIAPEAFHCNRSLRKAVKRGNWQWRINGDFGKVIRTCAALRAHEEGTWIVPEIEQAYTRLHKLGYAFSVEVYLDGELAGGFYGVAMGQQFYGESMFSLKPNGSKIALGQFCSLCPELGIRLIDCQVESDHLLTLGAKLMPRPEFVEVLKQHVPMQTPNLALQKLTLNHELMPVTFAL
jgi:leucyl/phenylalanyl-tRNA--protein transferase